MKRLLFSCLLLILAPPVIIHADFIDNGNGTVNDTSTGLVWQKESVAAVNWSEALSLTEESMTGGYLDWRLPNVNELGSIIRYDRKDPATVFPGTTDSAPYWSSTTSTASSSFAWTIDFTNGSSGTTSKGSICSFRAVRGGNPITFYQPDTWTDPSTGLMWQVYNNSSVTWESALSICDNLVLGGYSDWRLPDVNELGSIIRYDRKYPATIFPGTTDSALYWSSTTNTASPSSAWTIDFTSGSSGTTSKGGIYSFRAVRGVSNGSEDILTIAQWPMEGPAGTTFTQWGTGFKPGSTVTLHFRKPDGTELFQKKNVIIQGDGRFVETYTTPLNRSLGQYAWWAVDETSGQTSNIVTYTITAAPVPTIAQWPMEGPPGTRFEQWGTGFTPNSIVMLQFKKKDGTEYPPEFAPVNSDGNFKSFYRHFWDKLPGNYTWWAVDGPSGRTAISLNYQITAGGNGELAGFSISQNGGPISDQQEGISFPIRITARDSSGNILSGFDEKVYLTSNLGEVDPPKVTLINGVTNISVTLHRQGLTNLNCSYQSKYGNSNEFKVTGDYACSGSVEVRVTDTHGEPVYQALISIYDEQGKTIGHHSLTDKEGKFKANALSCGQYKLRVEHIPNEAGNAESVEKVFSIANDLPVKLDDIQMHLNVENRGTPVVLVPGILGSTSGHWSLYPKLSINTPDPAVRIHLPEILGWENLQIKLENENFLVFTCPWDWRLDCGRAYKRYLIPIIRKALDESTTGKVHVIAHSMGGLVTRAYIQSSDYNADIDKFIMVGTPNLGSSNPYYIWEGGDPKTVDDITDKGLKSVINVYTNSIQNLWEETYGKKDWSNSNHDQIREFVREVAPSLKQLMNTEAFLTDDETVWGVTTDGNENEWLKILNNDPNIPNLMSFDGANGTIHVKVFASNMSNTISKIRTFDHNSFWFSNSIYEDGRPKTPQKTNVIWGDGDGTVPYQSALWPKTNGWAEMEYYSSANDHAGLLKDETIVQGAIAFLTEGTAQQRSAEPGTRRSVRQITAAQVSVLSFWVSKNMRLNVIAPDGKLSGIEPTLMEPINEIPSSKIVFDGSGGNVKIDNPTMGNYEIQYFGEPGKDFHMEIGYLNESQQEIIKVKGYCTDSRGTFVVSFTPTSQPPLTLLPPVKAPDDLQADPYAMSDVQDQTRLTWPSTAGAIGFNVYAFGEDDLWFSMIGSVGSSVTSYDTNYKWSSTASIPVMTFAVTSVAADGSESFFSELVLNNDRDHDGLSDQEETAYGININDSDSDKDGLNDGQEHRYGTNPLKMDTDNDGFSDADEVQGGSDPLDPETQPLKGDINGDGEVNLLDAMYTLQILAGAQPDIEINPFSDVDGYGQVGLEEAIFILSDVASMR